MDECCGVAFPLLGKDVAFDLSFFISHCCYSRNFSFFFACSLYMLSVCCPFISFYSRFRFHPGPFFFYLSTYMMMMMTTNRRQCTIYSWRYPPSYLLSCLHPAIHTSILTRMIIAGSSSSYSSSPSIVQLVVVHTLRRLFFSFVPCSLL